MIPTKLPQRLYYADVLRALAIFAVIILHNAADYSEQLGEIPMSNWWAGATWNGLVRFCVPMFVMLSGAFLLRQNKVVSIKEVFYKRLPKVVIPLIFWSIVYVLHENFAADKSIFEINFKEQVKIFYQGPVIYHLWFLYMLIGIYLLYPVVNFFIASASKNHVRYFLIVWFVANCVIGISDIIFDIKLGVDLNFFTGYAGYFVLGYYLVHFPFSSANLRRAYLLGILGFALSVFTPYICILLKFENRTDLIESDFTPDIVFSCIGLFLWIKNRKFKKDRLKNPKDNIVNKIVSQVSKESFGIYLVHVLLMEIILADDTGYSEFLESIHPWILIPLKAIIILIASFAVVKIIRLVPYLRKVAG